MFVLCTKWLACGMGCAETRNHPNAQHNPGPCGLEQHWGTLQLFHAKSRQMLLPQHRLILLSSEYPWNSCSLSLCISFVSQWNISLQKLSLARRVEMQSSRSHGGAPHASLVAHLPTVSGSVDKLISLMGFMQSGPWAGLSLTTLISATATSHRTFLHLEAKYSIP